MRVSLTHHTNLIKHIHSAGKERLDGKGTIQNLFFYADYLT